MATLNDADFQWIQNWVEVHPTAKAELKAMNLPKVTWRSVFQGLENYMVFIYNSIPTTSIKQALEAVTGSLTNPQAFAIYDAWNAWKTYKRGSG